MSDREKLIEILSVPIYPHLDADPVEVVADYLIDNGVTVQKWIPVSERLPDEELWNFTQQGDWEVYPCLCSVGESRAYVTKLFYDGRNFVNAEYVSYTEDVTHWMPLPKPPKECE